MLFYILTHALILLQLAGFQMRKMKHKIGPDRLPSTIGPAVGVRRENEFLSINSWQQRGKAGFFYMEPEDLMVGFCCSQERMDVFEMMRGQEGCCWQTYPATSLTLI